MNTNFNDIKPLGYRTPHYSDDGTFMGDSPFGLGGFHSVGTLMDFFMKEEDHTLKFQFFNSKHSDIFRTIYKKVSIEEIARTMISLAEPVFEGFVETNDNIDFARSENFFYKLFFNEEIYASYNFFEGNNFKIVNEEKRERIEEDIEDRKEEGGFDYWLKVSPKDNRFMHLDIGIICEVPDWRERMIKVKWASKRKYNFLNWFAYSIKWCTAMLKLDNAENLLIKRVHIYGTNKDMSLRENLEERLNSESPVISFDIDAGQSITSKTFLTAEDLNALQLNSFNKLDRQSYELGRVSNTNPKGDRYSTGENYKDITGIAARQKATLTQLKLFASLCKEKWGLDLNFAVNGIPQTQIMEEHQEQAAEANDVKKPDAAAASSRYGQ